jgi:hypothetical protein
MGTRSASASGLEDRFGGRFRRLAIASLLEPCSAPPSPAGLCFSAYRDWLSATGFTTARVSLDDIDRDWRL